MRAGLIKYCDGTWLRPCNLTDSRQGSDAFFLCSLSRRTTFFSEVFIKPPCVRIVVASVFHSIRQEAEVRYE